MFNILTLDQVRKIEVEATTYCNAGCPHCSRHLPNTSKLDPDMQMNQITPELIYKLNDIELKVKKNNTTSLILMKNFIYEVAASN